MPPIVRNILAVLAGIVVGSIVNMALVTIGPMIVPLPEGADVSSMDAMRESMPLFTPANYLFPFLAHALGTLTGAFLAAKLGASHRMKLALGIGFLFLLGGIAAATMLGGPAWFVAADLILAYIPMALVGGKLAGAGKQSSQ